MRTGFLRTLALVGVVSFSISSAAVADILGGLESYGQWVDVTNQSSVGSWEKLDGTYPVTVQGELVTAPAHGSAVPRSGNLLLDLRTENQYESDNANNGANYNYLMNVDDFGGIDPASMSSGTVELDFWICPNTWSGDIGGFVPAGTIYQMTSLLNADGDILASVGMNSLGNSNSPEVHYSVDGENWINTGLIADASTWTNVNFALDLDAMTSQISFTDDNATTVTSSLLDWDSEVTDTSVPKLNFQQIDGVTKNYFDDFAFSVVASAIPEPSGVLIGMAAFLAIAGKRRRVS